jgi:ATP-binding cassette subfamily B protein/subfamily B ATP-binding cassette protein MsbA
MKTSLQEEEVLGKAYDARLMKRLIRYAKPYALLMILCILMLLAITGLRLLIPDITRRAIDNYMVATARIITFSDSATAFEESFVKKHQKELIPFGERTYIVRDASVKSFDEREVKLLQSGKFIGETRYTIIDTANLFPGERAHIEQMIARYPGLFQKAGTIFLVEYEKIRLIAPEDLKELRGAGLSGITRLFAIFLCVLAGMFLLSFAQGYLLEYIGQQIIYDIRAHLFSHLQKLSVSFFDKNPVGRLVTRVTNDVQALGEAFTGVMVNLFEDLFILGGVTITLLFLNLKLSLIAFCVLPPIIYATIIFRKKARTAFREIRIKIARINAYLQENITGMKVVQLFRRERKNLNRFKEINHENYIANFKSILVLAVFRPLIEVFASCAVALIVWYGGGQVIQDKLTLGALVAFLTYAQMFFRPIQDLSEKYHILQSAMASSERIFLLMDTPAEVKEAEKPKTLPAISGKIEFKDVWFAYDGEHHVLKGISFKIAPGEKVAIVGPTGSGKSTIINLLVRFYDTTKGSVLLDNTDIRELDSRVLRSKIGLVMQDVFIFSGSVKSNIRLGNCTITDDEVEKAGRYAKADSFIEKLPERYDREVKERGAMFSTGERQLLSFARALAFNPTILVLDEATSNTDAQTEHLIQEGLFNLIKGRTSIIVAHRLSTIRKVDRILVMQNGQIVEEGTHEELLAREGLYYKLYLLQYQTAPASARSPEAAVYPLDVENNLQQGLLKRDTLPKRSDLSDN